jgi:hypothetical protein
MLGVAAGKRSRRSTVFVSIIIESPLDPKLHLEIVCNQFPTNSPMCLKTETTMFDCIITAPVKTNRDIDYWWAESKSYVIVPRGNYTIPAGKRLLSCVITRSPVVRSLLESEAPNRNIIHQLVIDHLLEREKCGESVVTWVYTRVVKHRILQLSNRMTDGPPVSLEYPIDLCSLYATRLL